ncbi:MAG TPA: PAS domain S-box protein [Candidatus Eisenbacteria bacterium]|nr:PAS domain S-box protein [Candidatus Eisenbacteria bacterium]
MRNSLPGSIVRSGSEHTVRFYDSEASLYRTVADYLGPALHNGDPVIVVASEEHWQGICALLVQDPKIDVNKVTVAERGAMLGDIMNGEGPDRDKFRSIIGQLLDKVGGQGLPHVYGEMVDQLCAQGNVDAALRLEELWNELAETRRFRLLCGYAMANLRNPQTLDAICAKHWGVVASNALGPDANPELLREIARLQNRAQLLEHEVAASSAFEASLTAAIRDRDRASEALEARARDLSELFDSVPVALHWLDGNGIILRANQAELDLLGYEREAYVGHPIAEFHVDQDVVSELLARWSRGETVVDHPVRLRHKNGSIRHVIVSSKAKWDNGQFVHVNCFTRDVTERREAEELRMRSAAIVESSDDAIISKDLAGHITSWNPGAQRLYGYTAEEVVGRSIEVLIPSDCPNDFPNIMERLRRGERIEHYETVRVAKDGRRIDVSLTISPLRDAEGKIIGASKIARDITERKRTEAALRASEEKLAAELTEITRLHALGMRLLSGKSFDAALQDVLENAIRSCGAVAGNIQLYDKQSRTLRIAAHSGLSPAFLDCFRSVQAGDGTVCSRALEAKKRVVVEDLQKDLEFAPYRQMAAEAGVRSAQSSPLLSHEGEVLGCLNTHFAEPWKRDLRSERLLDIYARHATDVIERHRFEHALQEADRRKDEFIAVLAHELRNPLAPVRNAAHYLKLREFSDPDVRQPLEMIDRQVNLMSRLIEDLLDVSRITRGVLELRRERVMLSELVAAAAEACRHEVDGRRHEMRISLPDDPIALYADRARLIQVLCNLITNAAKYSPPGGRIDIRAVTHDQALEFSIRDQGVGIPPDKLTEIFNLFAQLDRSLEKQGGGLGIGLTLARQIMELHQGTIEARSEGLGKGSEFILRMPMLPAREPRKPNPASKPVGSRKKILVADDNRDSADSLAMLLGRRHEVHRAYDGAAALELAGSVLPDVMLLDIGMPKMDGYEVARRVRQEPWGTDMYLVALSGWGRDEDRQRAREAGFDAHLVKPATPEALDRLLAGVRVRPTG